MFMIKKLILTVLFVFLSVSILHSQVLFPFGSLFSYTKGISSSSVPRTWNQTATSVDLWSVASAPFWYGDGVSGVGTELKDIKNSYTTFYLRSTFNVEDIDKLAQVNLSYDYDDGFVLYINGQEVIVKNAPSERNYNATALVNHESGTQESLSVDPDDCFLVNGDNTIAVHVFNISLSSSDVYFDLQVSVDTIRPSIPDSLMVSFSDSSDFYTAPFTVQLTSPDVSYPQLKYTLDGSNPGTSSSAIIVESPANVLIDPSSSVHRAITPGVVLRACLHNDILDAGHISTQTYLFLDKVKTQLSKPGTGWPENKVNEQELYYGVNAAVANDDRYKDEIVDALLDIPSLSIVTDADNLFDPTTGIYVNALEDGVEWERPCSFELMNSDGSEGCNLDAGLRIRGGWSRHGTFQKHSFRLFFRKKYGEAKLKYPLFEDEGVDEFDKIDLRTAQNYAWAQGDKYNTMIREVFSRDLQGDMGDLYTRSRYYHLYINGLYWGLYQTQERAEAKFASSYLGGDAQDYDVVKASRVGGNLEVNVTDGTDEVWREIWDRMLNVEMTDDLYFSLIGCDAAGAIDPSIPRMVDVDNLIDFMIDIFYTGNFDSPISKFSNNASPNNFFAIYDRTNPLKGYHFLAHDAEHSLFNEAHNPGIGLYEDRVNLHTLTNNYKYDVTEFRYFSPQWLHIRFSENEEYRQRFADRAYHHLSQEGVLSQEASLLRVRKRMSEMSHAIIGESLRWGGKSSSDALTKDDHWLPEVNKILNNFIPYRTPILIAQLNKAKLYTTIDRPDLLIENKSVTVDRFEIKGVTDVTLQGPTGYSIVYTLDGSDPRAIGGGIGTTAHFSSADLVLNIKGTSQIITRSYLRGQWSAPRTLFLDESGCNLDYLKITELHYHPLDSVNDTDTIGSSKFEFIEFKNIHATQAINLGGLQFKDGISYTFPDNFILRPQEFYVIASNAYKFYLRYGRLPSGDYTKNLSNAGENISVVLSDDSVLFNFYYLDEKPWIADADGLGYSMVSYEANPITYTPDLPEYWWASASLGGSPFADDDASEHNASDLFQVQDLTERHLILFPNPTADLLQISIRSLDKDQMLNVAFYSIAGKLIYQTSCYNNASISLENLFLREGIYVVHVQTGDLHFVDKLIYKP